MTSLRSTEECIIHISPKYIKTEKATEVDCMSSLRSMKGNRSQNNIKVGLSPCWFSTLDISVRGADQMPSVRMKDKQNASCLVEKNRLHLCAKSNVISKKPCSNIKNSMQTEFELCTHESNFQTVSKRFSANEETMDGHVGLEESIQFQNQPLDLVNSAKTETMESTNNYPSELEITSSPVPFLESTQFFDESFVGSDAVSSNDYFATRWGTDCVIDNSSSCPDYQTFNVPESCSSEMIIANFPFDEDNTDWYSYSTTKYSEPDLLFDVVEQYMILPHLEDFAESNNASDPSSSSYQQTMVYPDDMGLYLALDEIKFCNGETITPDWDQVESYEPESFIRNLPEVSDNVSDSQPNVAQEEPQKGKPTTLVLDLDETLVHSTLEHCDDADFTFTVLFNTKEHTVYVKKRPHLHKFLERVAEMFEVVIFTASQSVYAEQVINVIDPDGKLICRRAFRDSCSISDGCYTKDLNVLGVDLAKVAIIDNSPQVFRLQVDNGIPIKSWFNDPSDCALISLLPFLEKLADAEDVRPLIAEKFGNKE